MSEIVEDLKEVVRALIDAPRPTDGANVGTPGDFAGGDFGAVYNDDDQSDYATIDDNPNGLDLTGAPKQPKGFQERSLAVPGGAPGYDDATTPMLDATEYLIEHGPKSIPEARPEAAGYERKDPTDVYQIGGDAITTMRVAIPIGGLTDQPLLRNDRRRLKARLRVLTAGKTVYVGNSQAAASGMSGWPISDTDQPLIIETQGELWVRSLDAEAAIITVALLTETRNMPKTV